jgi:predicted dehydrogenase
MDGGIMNNVENFKSFSVGIIGCGFIGRKRAEALGFGRLIACSDLNISNSKKLAHQFGAIAIQDWRRLIEIPELDLIIIATSHDALVDIALASIEAGKHVLIEKPAARSSQELKRLISASSSAKVKVRVGFNHRFHRSLQKAKLIIDSGELGDLMFLRARYGHGGRIGYEKEWRANPNLSGGGEMLDQGTHLIDLSRWFMGDFPVVQGFAHTYYWKMPVEDNGFMLLKTKKNQIASLHVSCTEWKNLFSMEIYGKDGKLELSGLGGSYGLEKLTHYKMLPQMGPPETTSWEYPMADNSWAAEMEEFYRDIELNREPSAGIPDAYEALKIIEKIYRDSGYDYCS